MDSESFKNKLDLNASRLIESYRAILKKSLINETANVHDDLSVQTAAASIVSVVNISLLFDLNLSTLHLISIYNNDRFTMPNHC